MVLFIFGIRKKSQEVCATNSKAMSYRQCWFLQKFNERVKSVTQCILWCNYQKLFLPHFELFHIKSVKSQDNYLILFPYLSPFSGVGSLNILPYVSPLVSFTGQNLFSFHFTHLLPVLSEHPPYRFSTGCLFIFFSFLLLLDPLHIAFLINRKNSQ